VYRFILCLIAATLGVVFFNFITTSDLHSNPALIQYTYKGPKTPVPGNPELVRIQILVRDSAEAGGVQVQRVEFNGEGIPLKPRDIYGNRGDASFQVFPGKYKLTWVVQKSKLIWPRTVTHEEAVNVSPRDLWLQIAIEGEQASIR
jgi:hypothetical protein